MLFLQSEKYFYKQGYETIKRGGRARHEIIGYWRSGGRDEGCGEI